MFSTRVVAVQCCHCWQTTSSFSLMLSSQTRRHRSPVATPSHSSAHEAHTVRFLANLLPCRTSDGQSPHRACLRPVLPRRSSPAGCTQLRTNYPLMRDVAVHIHAKYYDFWRSNGRAEAFLRAHVSTSIKAEMRTEILSGEQLGWHQINTNQAPYSRTGDQYLVDIGSGAILSPPTCSGIVWWDGHHLRHSSREWHCASRRTMVDRAPCGTSPCGTCVQHNQEWKGHIASPYSISTAARWA